MGIRSYKKYILISTLLIAGTLVAVAVSSIRQSGALSGSQWQAGKIISDGVFFSPNTMTVNSIQTFLNSKVPECDNDGSELYSGSTTRAQYSTSRGYPPPYVCLKNYSVSVPGTVADAYCSNGVAAGTKSAAQIINDVAKACGVNPRVLIVLLQKEQGLVTDEWPWPIQYTKATGYGCPDSNLSASDDANNNGCYDAYEGFFNQVWYAARQFQRYVKQPTLFNHRVGQTSNLRNYPDCSSSGVRMETGATAALYNYTPYQPNQAALTNLYGTGNSCSFYGNRNFWRYFNDWFGSTLVNPPPDQFLVGDWDGDGDDTIGVKRGSLYLLDNDADGYADVTFNYGGSTDIPIVGDWDGDGDDTIGLRIGTKYFINNELDGSSAFRYFYGLPDDIPLVGDWDGDGADTISRRTGHKIFINNQLDEYSEFAYSYGYFDYKPIVGDFDGNGVDTVGLRINQKFFINNLFDSYSDFAYAYGSTTDEPIVGNFDGDSDDTAGLNIGIKYFINNGFDGSSDYRIYFFD
ncbi:hypothetical protein A2886_03070 [candidate division WWE3 bacterium RIFCSPHIGHO2_01_FULL_42_13]|uniref:VCBS repeat-containing protein n=1 Tax=candidate division WWE3 bacterium RIFCSPHIGHO2_01_FULL_42_13 TaxID=1802617 RepID=A0A1F4UQH0_UNCKA|nr:MAG: hypothetical protein A2886_03070 [candidate division WWE3 bacterium RIFCSPHIGHO2_01_FULL_42_13]